MTDALRMNSLNSTARSKAALFNEVADWQKNQGFTDDIETVITELNYREKVGNTLLEEGFALPHVSNQVIKENNMLLVQLDQPIKEWDGEYPVDTCLFLFLQPNVNKKIQAQVKAIMITLADTENIAIFRSHNIESIKALIR